MVLIPARFLAWCERERTYLQEDIQLLSNVVNCGDLGLGFSDEIILLLLELFSPFVKSGYNASKDRSGEREG